MTKIYQKTYLAGGLFVFLSLLLSCRTLSPLTTPPETVPTTFSTPENVVPQWQAFAEQWTSGISYFEGRIQKPRLRFWGLRVDLTEPTLQIVVSKKEGNTDGVIPSIKTSSFVRFYNCLAGINATPFDPASEKEGQNLTIMGITISQGELVSLPLSKYDALVFYDNGKAAIVKQAAITEAQMHTITNAVGGFHTVLQNGTLTERALNRGDVRFPRSAAGLSADGSILYLLVIDGRQINSIGATEAELAIILQNLGANDGLNLDGGGSSALALKFPDGKVRTINSPVDKIFPGNERAVATCLGIALYNE